MSGSNPSLKYRAKDGAVAFPLRLSALCLENQPQSQLGVPGFAEAQTRRRAAISGSGDLSEAARRIRTFGLA
jgi:hypothetical protein